LKVECSNITHSVVEKNIFGWNKQMNLPKREINRVQLRSKKHLGLKKIKMTPHSSFSQNENVQKCSLKKVE
jgi:hypothetical protein